MVFVKTTNSFQVSQAEKVEAGVSEVVKDFGSVDIFIANAGMYASRFDKRLSANITTCQVWPSRNQSWSRRWMSTESKCR